MRCISQDGVDTEDSRWSCSPKVRQGASASDVCVARFDLNTYRYVRQIKLGEFLPPEGMLPVTGVSVGGS